MPEQKIFSQIVETLQSKSNLKQQVYDNTLSAFGLFRHSLQEVTDAVNSKLSQSDPRIKWEFHRRGDFDMQLKVAGDMLVFTMHTNIFQFDRSHEIWKTPYIKNDYLAGYSGVINVYNFLADSFKYQRIEDLGYLIARIFVNKNNHFFVQGKRQSGFSYTTLGSSKLTKPNAEKIVLAAVQYCLDFDLLVPPYDTVKLINVAQVQQNISDNRQRTGKRLGFQFRSDDVNG